MPRSVLLALSVLLFAACHRADPLSLRVESTDPRVYSNWRFLKSDELSPAQWKDFDAAVQELRNQFVSLNSAGRTAIEERVLTEIHGHTVQDVAVAAFKYKVRRLQDERRELQTAVDGNALIVVGPDDPATARDLAGRTERQIGRLRHCIDDLHATERQLATWEGKPPPPTREDASPAGPRALTREEALGQIDGFLERRRRGIRQHWGNTPAQIVRTSETLTGATREDFERKQAESVRTQHVVLAVHVQQHWWIYDGPAATPTFSDTVLAHLTPEDRERIATQWHDLKAEEWARNEAWSALPDGAPDLLRPDLKPDLKHNPPPLPSVDDRNL